MCSQAKSHPEDRLLLPFVRSPNWSIFQPWSLPLGAPTVAAQRQKLKEEVGSKCLDWKCNLIK